MKTIPTTFLISFIFMTGCTTVKNTVNTSTVGNFELQRYLGTWYEIARFDHPFERGLTAVTATYTLRNDGLIKVTNRGYKNTPDGKMKEAIGKAKIPDKTQPAKIKVSFFLFFYADYFIMELDENYQWALIGSSSEKYLWILSRTPQIEENLYNSLLKKANERGYDTSKLIRVQHRL